MGNFLPDYITEFAERQKDYQDALEAEWAERADRWNGYDGPVEIPVYRGM